MSSLVMGLGNTCVWKAFPFYNTNSRFLSTSFQFVPKHDPCCKEYVVKLQEFVDNSKSLIILSGAGISTESGIPDYRSESVGLYATSNRRPVQYQNFLKYPEVRQSYWARNYVGWPRFSSFKPNSNHRIIADWEKRGKVKWVITQNVDGLHFKAGSQNVTELHGTAYQVKCLSCSYCIGRHDFQTQLLERNRYLLSIKPGNIRPDGDVELPLEEVKQFYVPDCPLCNGILKPSIIFFGDNVPKARVDHVKKVMTSCDALLVIGSSLSVHSAYRFILFGVDLQMPIAILNIGETRGDKHARFRVPARCGEVLPLLTVENEADKELLTDH